MKPIGLFGLLAMVPAAINPAQAAGPASRLMTALVCKGDGTAGTVSIPTGNGRPSPEGNQPCCSKGCHGGNSRKRFLRGY